MILLPVSALKSNVSEYDLKWHKRSLESFCSALHATTDITD